VGNGSVPARDRRQARELQERRPDPGHRTTRAQELSGRVVFSASSNRRYLVAYNWNNKFRGHRRDTQPTSCPIIASTRPGTNPASSTQAKYYRHHNKLVFEASFSIMDGITSYKLSARRVRPTGPFGSSTRSRYARGAGSGYEDQPNSRLQFGQQTWRAANPAWEANTSSRAAWQFAKLSTRAIRRALIGRYLNYNTAVVPVNVQESHAGRIRRW